MKKRVIHIDKEHRSRYPNQKYLNLGWLSVLSTHKTSGAYLETSHNCSGDRDESARHEFPLATISAVMRQSRTLISVGRKQVSPSRVTLFS